MKRLMPELICIQNASMVCSEIAAATVAKYYKHDYEYMYIDNWNFNFLSYKYQQCEVVDTKKIFGGKLYVNDLAIEKNLFQYHGIIKYEKIINSSKEGIELLISCVHQNRLVSMRFDQYYLPWALEKRKSNRFRHSGYLLFYGYDKENDMFLCVDIHGDRKCHQLKRDIVYNAINNNNILFSIMNIYNNYKKENIPELSETIHYITQKCIQTDDFGNTFNDNMRQVAYYIKKDFNFEREINYTKKVWRKEIEPTKIMFVDDLIDIARTRGTFALLLEYISRKNFDLLIEEISGQFKILSSQWKWLVSYLIKQYYKNDLSNLNIFLYEKIIFLCNIESKLIEQFYYLDKKNRKTFINKNNINGKLYKTEDKYIDLTKYYNNKGVYNKSKPKYRADIDGLGNYFLYDDKVKEILPYYHDNTYDNIICAGQKISLNSLYCVGISIVGCCDSMNFCGEFIFNDTRQGKISKVIGFGEWRFERCEYGEKCIWEGDRMYLGQVKKDEKGFLFQQNVVFNSFVELISIELPKNDCMHIFSIILKEIN